MKNFTFLLALLVLTFSLKAQYTPPTIQWQKCLGGSLGDFAESIQQTKDGGYIVAGVTFSNDGDVFGNHSYSCLLADVLKISKNFKNPVPAS